MISCSSKSFCPHGKEVNTSPSHGEVCGSIPHAGTRKIVVLWGNFFCKQKKFALLDTIFLLPTTRKFSPCFNLVGTLLRSVSLRRTIRSFYFLLLSFGATFFVNKKSLPCWTQFFFLPTTYHKKTANFAVFYSLISTKPQSTSK